MKLAIIGTRGIPANYGGFETFAEELSTRLVARGHKVTVYGRSNNVRYTEPTYKGVELAILPTIGTKYLDTVVHTFLSVLHALIRKKFDCVLMCNAANALFALVPRLSGTPVALNVDGIERLRKKWGTAGRAYYRLSEYLATMIPNVVVSDAKVIRDYYLREYRKSSVMIVYGANCEQAKTTTILDQLGVRPRDYFLYVSRLEPENNAHVVVEAFEKVATQKRLLIVGDAPYAQKYIERLKSTTDRRIHFPGAIYGAGYRELQSHAHAYVHATEVGGTHPALVEAMGAGNCVIVKDTPENREVVGDCGLFFQDAQNLVRRIEVTLTDGDLLERLRKKATARAKARYSWDAVTDAYEKLFRDLRVSG
ncbi:MAG: glycosyl transferase family 1 [Acidobacteria bacterium]|nr:MAG: glycosyl transferase family 1 [Acidobacteriota bacterium]